MKRNVVWGVLVGLGAVRTVRDGGSGKRWRVSVRPHVDSSYARQSPATTRRVNSMSRPLFPGPLLQRRAESEGRPDRQCGPRVCICRSWSSGSSALPSGR